MVPYQPHQQLPAATRSVRMETAAAKTREKKRTFQTNTLYSIAFITWITYIYIVRGVRSQQNGINAISKLNGFMRFFRKVGIYR